jgi:hypothetical protein
MMMGIFGVNFLLFTDILGNIKLAHLGMCAGL